MSRGNNNELVSDGSAVSAAISNNSVLVISDCETDAEYVSGLLSQSGYRCKCTANYSTLPNNTAKSTYTEQYVATVVCHRKSTARQPLSLSQSLPGEKIIILSDCQSEQTVVSLLNSGAHFFFNFRESKALLQVRLEAALRQNGKFTNKSFAVGDIHFDAEKRLVTRQGKFIDLSPKEFDLAYYLFFNRERIVCNSELMTSLWSLPASMDTRRIDSAACHLRKKLKLNSENGWLLKRLRTVGYRLIPVEKMPASDMKFNEPLRVAVG